jgi:hypothetical protein
MESSIISSKYSFFDLTAKQCPVCSSHPRHIYQCTDCGEIRCGSNSCTGSFDAEYPQWATNRGKCRHCGIGTYQIADDINPEDIETVMERVPAARPREYVPPSQYGAF